MGRGFVGLIIVVDAFAAPQHKRAKPLGHLFPGTRFGIGPELIEVTAQSVSEAGATVAPASLGGWAEGERGEEWLVEAHGFAFFCSVLQRNFAYV